MKNKILWRSLSTLLAIFALSTTHAKDPAVPNEMIGHWEGTTKVIVEWCDQIVLPVAIDISPDGTVTGIIGDAKLTNAQIKKKSNWLGHKKGKRTTHIITGNLEGDIIEAEEISRGKVFIHLRIEEDWLLGGLATNGSKIGGKERMILTTTSLSLSKKINKLIK